MPLINSSLGPSIFLLERKIQLRDELIKVLREAKLVFKLVVLKPVVLLVVEF